MTTTPDTLTEAVIIDKLEAWRKEGSLSRDTPGGRNPHRPNTLASYAHSQGWLQRDLQLCLARTKPSYRRSQAHSITEVGIGGGYPFESHYPLITDEHDDQ